MWKVTANIHSEEPRLIGEAKTLKAAKQMIEDYQMSPIQNIKNWGDYREIDRAHAIEKAA